MNYELAKQLKDAGFPKTFYLYDETQEIGNEPTLSELIEACGDKLENLTQSYKGKWCCNYYYEEDENFGSDSDGSTPEIAVARLWLALNEKK